MMLNDLHNDDKDGMTINRKKTKAIQSKIAAKPKKI